MTNTILPTLGVAVRQDLVPAEASVTPAARAAGKKQVRRNQILDVLRVRGAHYHDYGKSPRPGRKLGHVTVVAPTPEQRDAALADLVACLE